MNYLLSLVTSSLIYLGLQVNCQGQTEGDNYFDAAVVHDIYITFSEPNWYDTLVEFKWLDDNFDSTVYLPATVTIDGSILDSVGVRFKGNSSYYNYTSDKKPFKLDFNRFISGQKFDGLKKMNLNNMYQDPTFMREKIFLDFVQKQGLTGPRAAYARVFVNGTYWGLYLSIDQIDKTFVDRVYGNKSGNLFKGDGPGAACADLEYHGSLPSYYACYELKTNDSINDWTDLVNLTDQINNTADSQFYDSVNNVMNTNSFIGAWACYSLFCNFDSYPFRFSHNYYTYHNSFIDKFEWIIWDVSTAFGNDIPWTVSAIENVSIFFTWPIESDRPLTFRMLQNPVFRQAYVNYICWYSQDFNPLVQNPIIDSLYSIIQADVYADTKKMYSNSQFDDNIDGTINILGVDYPGLKTFIANRYASIQAELVSETCSLVSLQENNFSPQEIQIYPNPASQDLFVDFGNIQTEKLNIQVFDVFGKEVLSKNYFNIDGGTHTFSTEGLSTSVYIIIFTSHTGEKFVKKFAVQK